MKFLWQQIVVFLIVLFTALTVSAYRISEYMEKKIYEDREMQLLRYGENIVDNYFSREDLVRASQLLSSEKIIIQVNLSDGRIIYPTYDQRFGSKLSKEDLEQIAKGVNVGLRYSQRYIDPDTQLQMATVYIPLKENQVAGFPTGFISLGAPLEDLEEKVTAMQEKVLFAYSLAGIAGIGISVFFSIYQTNKLKHLQKASQEIASGNYEIKVNTKGNDEFADLSRDFQKMADSLVQYEAEVERQESLRRQFMMDVAHEMRTPLTTMSGLLEGLRYNMIPENQVDRSLELIHSETQRLTRLVNENLDYERIRNKQISLKKVEIDTKELFEKIKAQLQVKADEKNNLIKSKVSDDFTLWADYDRIMQILINLVTNAIQFSQDSEIEIEASMVEEGSQIKVIDHGIGIDTAQIRSIWERFYKVDVSRKNTKFGESGIGLAVVQSLVEAHDGQIEVESEVGKGSVFTILLPRPTK
ncbi:sensor histidine kinase [Facklamia miroungae]|uniref:histidine kinase n=1 Tax=Facklamia miroungae TaxID=120956 RepID=A0A1G7RQJ8_9LACT|nr:HAMP domain-containing sensor histidine kinase [Facklamia miroungae]NKZ29315.1 HAMP domain-containing histidine kinase [Facklamia miroungae]SDG13097.1 Signal transduction histidine kinase [Facklamia miroungae]